ETVSPAQGLAEIPADDGGEQRAEIDAGIEKRETGIAARIVLRIELSDDGGNVRLEKAHAHDDQRQRQIEHAQGAVIARDHAVGDGRGMPFERHAEMPQAQQDAAEHHRLAHAQVAVGEHAAEHRYAVDQSAVCAEHIEADRVAELVVLDQVQQQQGLHSVEGEPLPHLGDDPDEDTFRVAEEFVAGGQGGGLVHADSWYEWGPGGAMPEYTHAPVAALRGAGPVSTSGTFFRDPAP